MGKGSAKATLLGASLGLAWVGTLREGPDGVVAVVGMAAWLAGGRANPVLWAVGWFVLATTLAGAGPAWAVPLALCGVVAGLRARPGPLALAVRVGALAMALMAVVGLSMGWDGWRVLAMACGGLLACRSTQDAAWRRGLRWASSPALAMGLVVLVKAASGAPLTRRDSVVARLLADPRAGEPEIARVLKTDPWVVPLWARVGWDKFSQGRWEEAAAWFRAGYRARPSPTNPCGQGLALAASRAHRWAELADLLHHRRARVAIPHAEAAWEVASELWRRGKVHEAQEVLVPWVREDWRCRHLAGWLAWEMGDASRTLALLGQGDEPLRTGESSYRALLASRAQGASAQAETLLGVASPRFPHHLGLARLRGDSLRLLPRGAGVVWGGMVRLVSWDCEPCTLRAGDTLTVGLAWEPLKPLPRLQVILHLDLGRPPAARINGDFWPAPHREATRQWPVGEAVVVTRRLPIPPSARPGTYTLWVGLWTPPDPATRLRVSPPHDRFVPKGDQRFPLAKITLTPPGA